MERDFNSEVKKEIPHSKVSLLKKIVVILGFTGCLVVAFYLGRKSLEKFDLAVLKPTPTDSIYQSGSYLSADFFGHYYHKTPFSYKYPQGWHVWSDTEGGSDDLINKINLHPFPYQVSEFGNPMIIGIESPYNNSLNEVFNPDEICPLDDNYNCLDDYTAEKLNYSLEDDDGYCYQYQEYKIQSGINQEVISCVLEVKEGISFKFTLNNLDYKTEFRHFVESISTENL